MRACEIIFLKAQGLNYPIQIIPLDQLIMLLEIKRRYQVLGVIKIRLVMVTSTLFILVDNHRGLNAIRVS